jgi:hypothetical protein
VSLVATWAFLTSPGGTIKNSVQVIRPGPVIEPIDGDTVRSSGKVYRLPSAETSRSAMTNAGGLMPPRRDCGLLCAMSLL